LLKRWELVAIVLGGLSLFAPQPEPPARAPQRLAIYYGYPSLVNEAAGDIEKAASAFGVFDVIVLGDGVEFADHRADRQPNGVGAEEHEKARQIIASIRSHSPARRVYGYICLGDSQRLGQPEIERRADLWKAMGVSGIFLDEAGYDWKIVDRKRQNAAIAYIHSLGLSAFLNAFYPRDLFSAENLSGKNPDRAASLMDQRDLFLLESFQVENGSYEEAGEWQQRGTQALNYRSQFGSSIFATTTSSLGQPFDPRKLAYAWWGTWFYGLDGFSWGEPNFAGPDSALPDRGCPSVDAKLINSQERSRVETDGVLFWRRVGSSLFVIDTANHVVRVAPVETSAQAKLIDFQLVSLQHSHALTCGASR
jgi:hypothetical protein